MTTAGLIAAVFVIGFLLGDRRGVKQCNAILDENWRELLLSIREEEPIRLPEPPDLEESQQSTLH